MSEIKYKAYTEGGLTKQKLKVLNQAKAAGRKTNSQRPRHMSNTRK